MAEIIGSVTPQEVPVQRGRPRGGFWVEIAERVLADHNAGRVTVVRVADQKELERLRGGITHRLRALGWRAHTTIERKPNETLAYIQLVRREDAPSVLPPAVSSQPIKRIRIGGPKARQA